MTKILCISALAVASIYYAQIYPASTIPEDLKKNANVVIRKDFTSIDIKKIDQIVYQFKTVTTVLNKDGDAKAIAYIPYDKSNNISDVKVTIYDESGKKTKSFSKSDFKDFANNPQGTFYSDNRVLMLEYTPSVYPYTVDFSYQTTNKNTVFIPDFLPFSSVNTSLEVAEYIINNTSGIDIKTKIYPSPYNYTEVIDSSNASSKSYSYKNVPAVEDATLLPQIEKILPKVSFSLVKFNLEGKQGSINDWADFGTWYYNSILNPVSISTPAIKAEVAALNLQGSTEDKVKKLYQHLQAKTRYVFVALGIGGWQPMLPEEVQKKGYGDCKGLTNYMKTLLDEAGIPSYYSVINMDKSAISFDEYFPKMGGNHVILMVPTEKGNIWLENTSQLTAFNHLSYSTTDRNVLSIRKNGIEIIQTPKYSASQSKEKLDLKVALSEDNSISGEGKFAYTGSQYDYNLGFVNLTTKERNEALRSQIDVLNFDKLEMSDFNNDKDNAVITYKINFKANNFSKNAGNSIIFRSVPIYSNTIYKTDEKRELPFEVRQSFEDNYSVSFIIPSNYKIEEIPENIIYNSEFGSYQMKTEKIGNEVKVNRVITVNKGTFPKEKYNDYIKFRKKANNLDNSKILITKI